MKKLLSILLLSCCGFLFSCENDQDPADRHCWTIIDALGNTVGQVCNRTEAELLLCASNGSCGFPSGTILTQCDYYQSDGAKFCYSFNGTYAGELTESQAAVYGRCFFGGATPVKVNCQNCAFWYHREKRTYKPTGQFVFSSITRQNFCGDTLTTLYQGRQIIRKDDADSLVVIQFSNNGTNW